MTKRDASFSKSMRAKAEQDELPRPVKKWSQLVEDQKLEEQAEAHRTAALASALDLQDFINEDEAEWMPGRRIPVEGTRSRVLGDYTRTFQDWLEEKAARAFLDYGIDFASMEGAEFSEELRGQALALIAEVIEFIDESHWKPWSTVQGRSAEQARKRAVVEFADMMMFMGNLAVLLRIDPAELDQAITDKYVINAARQASKSYTGSKLGGDKCEGCGRSLDSEK